MKREDITKVAQAWNAVQEASYGKPKKEAMDPVDHKELKGKHKDRKDKDINNDGKVDSTDKYLHNRRKTVSAAIKGKKKDQEVEVQTSEAKIDEISKKTLGSYVKKASDDMANNAYALGARDPLKPKGSWNKAIKRGKGIAKATDKLAKEEIELDEVLDTPKAMARYRDKATASRDAAASSAIAKDFRSKDQETRDHPAKELKTMAKRTAGLRMVGKKAADKLRKDLKKESVEQIDELKKSTLSSYIKKASGNMAGNTAIAATQASSSMKKASPDVKRNIFKRAKGIAQASDKLAKEAVDHGNMNNGSPAGEGLSPSAKDQLAKKTPAPSDAFDANMVNKKTFDAMRASAKKATMRTNDNPQGDKTPPKSK